MVRNILMSALLLAALGTACGPRYLPGTKVEATEEREEVAAVVEQYRRAVEQRDNDAVRKLVSATYYENASTTEDPSDDYDAEGLDNNASLLSTSPARLERYLVVARRVSRRALALPPAGK
jgi:hypothetical protein